MLQVTKMIAIIDDGIHPKAYPFLHNVSAFFEVNKNGRINRVAAPMDLIKTHGTLCAAIISLYAPQAQMISIQVLDPTTESGTAIQLKAALEWCLQENISIINLSIGSTCMSDQKILQPVFSSLIRRNCVVIAAMSNSENFSIITDYTGVFSVKKDSQLSKDEFYYSNPCLVNSDFCASSRHYFPMLNNETESIISQNSHAAPVITAKVFEIQKKEGLLPIGKIFQFLSHTSTVRIKALPDFIDAAFCVGKPIWPQDQMSFNLISDDLQSAHEPYFCAIFPDNTIDLDDIVFQLSETKNWLRGILYAGLAPEPIKKICSETGSLLWEEGEYLASLQQLDVVANRIEIPVVVWKTMNAESLADIKNFQNFLIHKGYKSKVFSNCAQSYCCDIVFVPSKVNPNVVLTNFISTYHLDILLLWGIFPSVNPDVCIEVMDEKCSIRFENESIRIDWPCYINEIVYKILLDDE